METLNNINKLQTNQNKNIDNVNEPKIFKTKAVAQCKQTNRINTSPGVCKKSK